MKPLYAMFSVGPAKMQQRTLSHYRALSQGRRWREVPSASWLYGPDCLPADSQQNKAGAATGHGRQKLKWKMLMMNSEPIIQSGRFSGQCEHSETEKDIKQVGPSDRPHKWPQNWPLRPVVTEKPGNPEKADWVTSGNNKMQRQSNSFCRGKTEEFSSSAK